MTKQTIATLFAILVFGLTPVAVGGPATEKGNTTSAESSLQSLVDAISALKGATPDSKQLTRIYAIWKSLPESADKAALRPDIVLMACSGFLAIGDMASFGKARSTLPNMESFVKETTEPCEACGGSGIMHFRCTTCGGDDRCSRCGGSGEMRAAQLAGMGSSISRACPTCHGSGRCPDCNAGMRKSRHEVCNGTGRRISASRSLVAFEEHRAVAETKAFAMLQKGKGEAPSPVSADTRQQGGAGLQQSLQSLKKDPFLIEDVIHACNLLLTVQPNDDIRKMLKDCDYRLTPLRKAAEAKSISDWRHEIEILHNTALRIQQARKRVVVDNKDILFDYETYVKEFCDSRGTALKRNRLIQTFWDKSFASKSFKDWCRISFVPVPKGMKFVVSDVSTEKNEYGTEAYRVSIHPLIYGKHDRFLGKEWRDDPNQTELYVSLVSKTGGVGDHLCINVTTTEEPESWSKGTILEADQWLATWGVEMSVSVFEDGRKRENRKIHGPSFMHTMFRSEDEMLDLE